MTVSDIQNRRIIALLTDFGGKDPFAGIMKGVIYSINPDAVITDLTHCINPHNVFEGAFCLYESYKYFPPKTIFLCVVDPGVGGQRKGVIIQTPDYCFIGPDNGLMSLAVKDNKNINAYEISNKKYMLNEISNTFHGRDVFAPAVAYLSKGINPDQFGSRIKDINRIEIPAVKEYEDYIEGMIIYTDKFGNLITNIEAGISRKIKSIEIKNTLINKISSSYEDGEPGRAVAIIGSAGFLEIAVNSGSAEKSLSVNAGEPVIIKLD